MPKCMYVSILLSVFLRITNAQRMIVRVIFVCSFIFVQWAQLDVNSNYLKTELNDTTICRHNFRQLGWMSFAAGQQTV